MNEPSATTRPVGFFSYVLPRAGQEGLLLLLQPLSLGFHQRLREHGVVPPCPPLTIARDSQGRPLRDGQGSVVTHADLQAADYRRELERHHQRVAVLAIAEALRGDPQFSLSRPSSGESDWNPVADRLFADLEEQGFLAGDLLLLCREICRISNLLDDHLGQAQGNFSRGAAVPS